MGIRQRKLEDELGLSSPLSRWSGSLLGGGRHKGLGLLGGSGIGPRFLHRAVKEGHSPPVDSEALTPRGVLSPEGPPVTTIRGRKQEERRARPPRALVGPQAILRGPSGIHCRVLLDPQPGSEKWSTVTRCWTDASPGTDIQLRDASPGMDIPLRELDHARSERKSREPT